MATTSTLNNYLHLPGQEITVFSQATVNSTGDYVIAIPAGTTVTGIAQFALPRSTVASEGSRLNSIGLSYKVNSDGDLTSVGMALARIAVVDNTAPTNTSIAITQSVAPATTANTYSRAVFTVNSPAYDNQASSQSIYYQVTLSFVAPAGGNRSIILYGLDIVYDYTMALA